MFRFGESFVKITVRFSGFWWFKLHLGGASHFMLAPFNGKQIHVDSYICLKKKAQQRRV